MDSIVVPHTVYAEGPGPMPPVPFAVNLTNMRNTPLTTCRNYQKLYNRDRSAEHRRYEEASNDSTNYARMYFPHHDYYLSLGKDHKVRGTRYLGDRSTIIQFISITLGLVSMRSMNTGEYLCMARSRKKYRFEEGETPKKILFFRTQKHLAPHCRFFIDRLPSGHFTIGNCYFSNKSKLKSSPIGLNGDGRKYHFLGVDGSGRLRKMRKQSRNAQFMFDRLYRWIEWKEHLMTKQIVDEYHVDPTTFEDNWNRYTKEHYDGTYNMSLVELSRRVEEEKRSLKLLHDDLVAKGIILEEPNAKMLSKMTEEEKKEFKLRDRMETWAREEKDMSSGERARLNRIPTTSTHGKRSQDLPEISSNEQLGVTHSSPHSTTSANATTTTV